MRSLLIISFVFVGCATAPGQQQISQPGKPLFDANGESNYGGPSLGERTSKALEALAQGFQQAATRSGGQCMGYAPYPPIGCKMSCIDGRWQSVCD